MPWLVGVMAFFIGAVLGHVALSRMHFPRNIVLRFLLVGSTLGAGLVWWLYEKYGLAAPETWAGVLIYIFCCELYVFLFTLVISSISANVLINLSFRDMTDHDVSRLYDSRHMVAARLDRLVSVGLLDESPSGLKLTEKGRRLVQFFNGMRAFFHHSPSSATLQ